MRRSLFHRWGELRKEIPDIYEVVVEDLPGVVQQTKDCLVWHRVVDVLAFLAADYNAALSQDCKLLRKRTLFNFKTGAEFVYANFPRAQSVQNSDPHRMRQGLEKFGCELGQLGHICIYLYLHIGLYKSI